MILLTTLNARYSHASLGLRYLFANLGELEGKARVIEFVIGDRPLDIVEVLLRHRPLIVGFGVYIWNAAETEQVVALLKTVAPDIAVVLGGPEVSHEWEEQSLVARADHIITGPGEFAFAALCRRLLQGEAAERVIHGEAKRLDQIMLPYRHYSDRDIRERTLYVEASRGCPFKCEFCLSALDKTSKPFDLDRFLAEMDELHRRGARQFKFVDRTFNLNVKLSARILAFFLDRLDDRLFLHFEVIPDHLPDALKDLLQGFPPGQLQLEVGIQTFNPLVQQRISRVQDNERSEQNLRWLRTETHAHLHTDLIVGLPGEDMQSFAVGFDRLVGLDPHEIQVGILKRLRGAPISRRSEGHGMRYSPLPPYQILQTDVLSFDELQRLGRFARYWDLVGNSGRFVMTRALLLGEQPFDRFLAFSDWLYAESGKTHQLGLDRLFDWVYRWLVERGGIAPDLATGRLREDFLASGARSVPRCLERELGRTIRLNQGNSAGDAPKRQSRHAREA